MELFRDNDTATEILSRLSVQSLLAFKCTSKRWYNFVSDPSFLRIHYKRVKRVPGIVAQEMFSEQTLYVNHLTITETRFSWNDDHVLDFLPEQRVVLKSSSNGILCCRSLEIQNGCTIYICNPVTRQWVQVRSKPNFDDSILNNLGLAFYPFFSSMGGASLFKLVNLKSDLSKPDMYLFDIYSSDTNKWETSKEVCMLKSDIFINTVIFQNGWMHWLTKNHQILAFHVENELSKVIDFPFLTPYLHSQHRFRGACFGESERYFHYVYFNKTDEQLEVWVLKNYEKPAWELKYSLNIPDFCRQHSSVLYINGVSKFWGMWNPVAFCDDVVYTGDRDFVISYNFRTKRMINDQTVLQTNLCDSFVFLHCISLVPLHEPVIVNRKRKFHPE